MKVYNKIYSILLCTGFSLLMSCTSKKKGNPKPIPTIVYTYKLTYDTIYIIQVNGDREPGTGRHIDSAISVTFGVNPTDSLYINGYAHAYQGTNLYFNTPRNQVSFSGPEKMNIAITYMNGIGGSIYHTYRGVKQ